VTADELAELSAKAARTMTAGGGLKALAQLLADAMQGAVLIEDAQWRHLVFAESGARVRPLPPSFEPYYAADARRDAAPARVRINAGLSALCAPMPGRPSEDAGPSGHVTLFVRSGAAQGAAALRLIAGLAGIEYTRRSIGRAQQRDQFWERLLAGGFADHAALSEEAAAVSVSLPSAFIAAAVDVQGAPLEATRDALLSALSTAKAVCPCATQSAFLPVLFPVRNQADAGRVRQAVVNAARELGNLPDGKAVTCGIGTYHPELLQTALSLKEAAAALKLGRRLFGRGAVTVYSDLGLYAVLDASADRHALRRFADSCIEPLDKHDRKHKTELLKTLALYFDVGENVKEAAERLCVHRHTVFYRLNQIAQLLAVDLRSPKDQLSLRAALAIRQIYGEELPPDE
jgi:hypothetical protein